MLALGGTAAILRRRRHSEDEDHAFDEDMYEPEFAEEAPAVAAEPEPIAAAAAPVAAAPLTPARSAFAWGNSAPVQRHESWEERARRGPTPDNPSLSLKKRLKRAAFFDNREREIAAGRASRVDAIAGLPGQVAARVHAQRQSHVTARPALQPA